MVFFILSILGLVATIVYTRRIQAAVEAALTFGLPTPRSLESATLAVIIPAYNEADNIQDCVRSVLHSTDWTSDRLQVWVVDDQSSDETAAIVQALQQELNDPRLRFLAGQPRPLGEVWVGKNWACTQAIAHADGEFLLFLDADVRLKSEAIARTLSVVQQDAIDLLTLMPAIVCGCAAEWLAQPLIMALLAVGSNFVEVNDPNSDTAFAAGPFMLFRRSTYEKLGGHRSVAAEVVEDVELARRTKQHGFKLRYGVGHEVGTLRMYRTNAALWEGWSKNWYQGSQRNVQVTLYAALIMVMVYTVPWLSLLEGGVTIALSSNAIQTGRAIATIAVSAGAIVLHYIQRRWIQQLSTIPPRYWWLSGVGGALVAAIAVASIIKTETGWGWTWRGRSLKVSSAE